MTDGIQIPEQDVAPMENIAAGVGGLRIMLVNVFAVGSGNSWVLIDAGLYLSAGRIRRECDAVTSSFRSRGAEPLVAKKVARDGAASSSVVRNCVGGDVGNPPRADTVAISLVMT
jgi:hypothetical protein